MISIFFLLLLSLSSLECSELTDLYLDAYKANNKQSAIDKKSLDVEILEFSENSAGDLSFDASVFLQDENQGNTIVVNDSAYSFENDSSSNSTLFTMSLSYKKNLWNRGVNNSFDSYINSKKSRIIKDNLSRKMYYFLNLNSKLISLLSLEKELKLRKAELKFYKKIDKRTTVLLKRGLVSSMSAQRIQMMILNFKSDLVLLESRIREIRLNLEQLLRGSRLEKILSVLSFNINEQRLSDSFNALNICTFQSDLDSKIHESIALDQYQKHTNMMKLDLISSVSLVDRNGWDNPDSNVSAGLLLSIPFGSKTSQSKKLAIERLKLRLLKKQQNSKRSRYKKSFIGKMNDLRRVYEHSSFSERLFLKEQRRYEKLFLKGLLSLDSLLKAYSSYMTSVYSKNKSIFDYNLKYLENSMLCEVK